MEFGGIESSPDYDTLMKAVAVVKANEPETFFILAVGGGSICDGCKFIALASMYNGSDPYGDLLEKQEEEIRSAVPLGVVVTLPATGSESNSNCAIACHRTETSSVSTICCCCLGSRFLIRVYRSRFPMERWQLK